MKKKGQLIAELAAVQFQLASALEKRQKLQEEVDRLTAVIPELESRQAVGLNAALACCGCGRGLKEDGDLTVYSVLEPVKDAGQRGILDLSKLKQLKGFVSIADADEFALSHGWQIADSDGPNHRCPDCVKKEAEKGATKRRGAYINLATGREMTTT